MTTILVLGGVRSGKSRYAEALLTHLPHVTYVAAGPAPDPDRDPEWAARVRAHRQARPSAWTTVETGDVPLAVAAAPGAVLVDCVGTWVTRVVDDAAAWDDPHAARAAVEAAGGRLVAALTSAGSRPIVLVSNEVGLGVVPAHRSGRTFRDLLGVTNAHLADASDHVALVVAGRVLDLSAAPRLDDAPRFALAGDAAAPFGLA